MNSAVRPIRQPREVDLLRVAAPLVVYRHRIAPSGGRRRLLARGSAVCGVLPSRTDSKCLVPEIGGANRRRTFGPERLGFSLEWLGQAQEIRRAQTLRDAISMRQARKLPKVNCAPSTSKHREIGPFFSLVRRREGRMEKPSPAFHSPLSLIGRPRSKDPGRDRPVNQGRARRPSGRSICRAVRWG